MCFCVAPVGRVLTTPDAPLLSTVASSSSFVLLSMACSPGTGLIMLLRVFDNLRVLVLRDECAGAGGQANRPRLERGHAEAARGALEGRRVFAAACRGVRQDWG